MKSRPANHRAWKRKALLVLTGLLLPVLLAELLLRCLPVANSLRVMAVTEDAPIARFEPNRTVYYSDFWNLKYAHPVHLNNEGFRCDYDYSSSSPRPLLAIIGDSFVEAAILEWPETSMARMAEHFEGRARVYSFGTSGSQLCQYLAYAKYVREKFEPSHVVFYVVENDIDKSHEIFNRTPSFHYFRDDSEGGLESYLRPYEPSYWQHLARRSALARYLFLNLKSFRVGEVRMPADTQPTNDSREAISHRVIDAFLNSAPEATGLPPERITLVVDAARPEVYSAKAPEKEGYFSATRRHFLAEGKARGFQVVDMEPIFREDFLASGERFEFVDDRHWNARAHSLVAEAVIAVEALQDL